jgi:3-hydroxybutyryl-CoA dehydrogenase
MAGIRSLGIVGAGQMGIGIAQVAVQNGLNVVLLDANRQQVEKGLRLLG